MYLQTRNTKTKQWLKPRGLYFCRLSHHSLSTHPNPWRSADAQKKKKKKILEKAQRYSRDLHSKKLPAESGGLIDSRLREKCARRLRWRHPV